MMASEGTLPRLSDELTAGACAPEVTDLPGKRVGRARPSMEADSQASLSFVADPSRAQRLLPKTLPGQHLLSPAGHARRSASPACRLPWTLQERRGRTGRSDGLTCLFTVTVCPDAQACHPQQVQQRRRGPTRRCSGTAPDSGAPCAPEAPRAGVRFQPSVHLHIQTSRGITASEEERAQGGRHTVEQEETWQTSVAVPRASCPQRSTFFFLRRKEQNGFCQP